MCAALPAGHGHPHLGAMDEKLKSEYTQKQSSFLCLCYISRAIRAGRCRERRYADHIFIRIYFRMHRVVVRFSNFSSLRFALNPADVPATGIRFGPAPLLRQNCHAQWVCKFTGIGWRVACRGRNWLFLNPKRIKTGPSPTNLIFTLDSWGLRSGPDGLTS